jgi:hypothetical protein
MTSKRKPQTLTLEPHIVLGDGNRAFATDDVRIGRGAQLWSITSWDGRQVTIKTYDTNRTRTVGADLLVLSQHVNPCWY